MLTKQIKIGCLWHIAISNINYIWYLVFYRSSDIESDSLYVGTMLILCAFLCRWAAWRVPGLPESPHQAVCLPPGQRQWAVWADGWISLVCVNCHYSLNHCQSTVTISLFTVSQLSLIHHLLSINCHLLLSVNCHYSLDHRQSTVTTSSFIVNQLSPLHHLLSITCQHFINNCQSNVTTSSCTVNQLSQFYHLLSINCHYSLNHCQSTINYHHFIIYSQSTVIISSLTVNLICSLLWH